MVSRTSRRPWLGTVEVRTFVQSRQGGLIPIEEAPKPRHWNGYEGGSVEILVNGRAVVARETWDDIEPLWAHLAGLIATLNRGWPYATTSYPDRPIPIGIAHQSWRFLQMLWPCLPSRS